MSPCPKLSSGAKMFCQCWCKIWLLCALSVMVKSTRAELLNYFPRLIDSTGLDDRFWISLSLFLAYVWFFYILFSSSFSGDRGKQKGATDTNDTEIIQLHCFYVIAFWNISKSPKRLNYIIKWKRWIRALAVAICFIFNYSDKVVDSTTVPHVIT